MSTTPSPLFAIITGTLSQGFSVTAIVADNAGAIAADIARTQQVFAEVLPVQDPAGEAHGFTADRNGTVVVFLGNIHGGELFGPFADEDTADCFGGAATADSEGNAAYHTFAVNTA